MGAAPGERARRAVVVGVVVAVVEWCAAGGLAWFPWIWGGFRLVLGRNPANATSRGRRVRRVRGKVRAGLLASGAEVPVEPPLAGSPTPPAVKAAKGGVWGLGIYPLEVTPLGRRKARISKHAASQHFDCSPR